MNNADNEDEGLDDKDPGSDSRKKGARKGSTLKPTKLPSCSLPTNMTPTFYVGGGNGVTLVENTLNNLGWKRTTDKFDERFKLKWVECKTRINYGNFKEGEQLVNHLPNSHLLTNKLGLLNSLKEYERVTLSTKGRLPRLKMIDFVPETYKLDEKSDRETFLETYKEGEIWICKPVGMNQGKGIFLIRTREAIDQLLEEREQRKQSQQKPGRPLMNRIVQRYIPNPLLLDGRKFDVRAYMLIASTVPFLILFHKGYVRLTCMKYDPDDTNLGIHLTNQFVQKKDPMYKDIKEDTAWSMDKFNDYINQHVRPNSHVEFEEDWVYNGFTKQMQKIMIHCFNSVKHKLQARVGFFDLFGLDFMVDTDMKVSLIEVNTNPALHCNCEALKEVIPGVVEEALYVSIECFEKSRKHQPLMPLQSLKSFTILYCGTRANTVIPRQSRSVSPAKDSSNERPMRPIPAAAKRMGSPSRGNPRSSTQSTQLQHPGNLRRMSDRSELSNSTAKSASIQATSANVKSAPAAKTKTKDEKTDKSSAQDGESTNKANSKPSESKSKSGTVVLDTLSKTTDSLNQATSTLGKLTTQLNQVGLTDSLLEEVRLKMTHAENGSSPGPASSPGSTEKPTSATPSRDRENLERGN